AGDGAEDARAAGIAFVVDQHDGVRIEPHVAAVGPAGGGFRSHDDALHDGLLLDFTGGQRVLDAANYDVAQTRHATAAAAEHLDAHHFLGTGVVGDVQSGLHLD